MSSRSGVPRSTPVQTVNYVAHRVGRGLEQPQQRSLARDAAAVVPVHAEESSCVLIGSFKAGIYHCTDETRRARIRVHKTPIRTRSAAPLSQRREAMCFGVACICARPRGSVNVLAVARATEAPSSGFGAGSTSIERHIHEPREQQRPPPLCGRGRWSRRGEGEQRRRRFRFLTNPTTTDAMRRADCDHHPRNHHRRTVLRSIDCFRRPNAQLPCQVATVHLGAREGKAAERGIN